MTRLEQLKKELGEELLNELNTGDLKVVFCNKYEPKSDWYCKNLNPEGVLSNNCRFMDLGEIMHLYDDNGKYLKTLYCNSELKKEIMKQYNKYDGAITHCQ